MKTIKYVVGSATVVLIVVFTIFPTSQTTKPPNYAAATEVSVSGVVDETREFFCAISDDQGAHLVLNTDQGKLLVHVAPARFLRTQQFAFHPGDQVTAVGTRVNYQHQDAMLAREITRGNEVLIVRDHQGRPLWVK